MSYITSPPGTSSAPSVDGWIPVTDTWTFASSTTVTVPSGATALYAIGDKVKFTQTTVKYFYITAVASTTLTLNAGTDYSVANAPISAISVAKGTAVGFPNYFTWDPAPVGVGGITYSTIHLNLCRFVMTGAFVYFWLDVDGTISGTGNELDFDVPVQSATSIAASYYPCWAYDSTIVMKQWLYVGGQRAQVYAPSGANWGTGSGKGFAIQGGYVLKI